MWGRLSGRSHYFKKGIFRMNAGWALLGVCCLGAAAALNPTACAFGVVGTAILLLVHINRTMGEVVRLSRNVVRIFTFNEDGLIEALQALSIAMIRWRKI